MNFPHLVQINYLLKLRETFGFTTKVALALLAIGIFAGCGSQSTAPSEISITDDEEPSTSSSSLLDLAARSSGRLAQRYLLQAFKQSIFERDYALAVSLSPQIDLNLLDETDRISKKISETQLWVNDGEIEAALAELQNILPTADLSAEWNYRLGEVQSALRNYQSASQHYFLCSTDEVENPDASYGKLCSDQLWDSLFKFDTKVSSGEVASFGSRAYQAWIELANIVKNNSVLIEVQVADLRRWIAANARHPARLNLPHSAQALLDIETGKSLSIAVVLPLSGRLQTAGEAILDGFLSALYATEEDGFVAPSIEIFDSNQLPIELIVELINSGSYDLAVGPLDADKVNAFMHAVPGELNVLTLNRLGADQVSAENHVGYSLSIETEGQQGAQAAIEQGARSALLLIDDTAIGERAASAFTEQWLSEDRKIVDLVRLSDATSLTKALEQSFHVDQSEKRKAQLQTLLGKRLEFVPRRRQDIDTIFLASSAVLARQVVPTLAFLFAENIPVLAVARVYEESANAESNRDLENLQFLAPPWLASQQSSLVGAQSSRPLEYRKLEAMGVDAFYLSRRFSQLGDDKLAFFGKTGRISMGRNGNLERTMEWVTLRGNKIVPVAN